MRADQAAAYGITTATGGPTMTIADVGDLWVERVLDGDRWIVAGRLVPDDRGLPVIAELRIFPFEGHRPNHFLGRWGAEVLGITAHGVPRGGLSATFIRRQAAAQVTRFERLAAQAIAMIARVGRATISENGQSRIYSPEMAQFSTELQAAGFDVKRDVFAFVNTRRRGDSRRVAGRPETPALMYARMAEAYGAAYTAGRHPVPELIRQGFAKTRAAAKSMVARARKKGFLDAAGQTGRVGGLATQKAKDVIAQASAQALNAPQSTQSKPARTQRSAKRARRQVSEEKVPLRKRRRAG